MTLGRLRLHVYACMRGRGAHYIYRHRHCHYYYTPPTCSSSSTYRLAPCYGHHRSHNTFTKRAHCYPIPQCQLYVYVCVCASTPPPRRS